MVSTRTSLMLLFIVPVFIPGLISASNSTIPCSPREGLCTDEGAYCESTDIQCRDGYKGAIGDCSRNDPFGQLPLCQCCKPETNINIPTQKPTTPKPVPCSPRDGLCNEEGSYCESTDIQCRDGYKGAIGECSREDAHGRIPHCQCCKPEIITLPTPSLPKPAICESKNKCKEKNGTCQSKSANCDGKIIKGGCRGGKHEHAGGTRHAGGNDCVCCAASVTPPPKCKTGNKCTKKGGKCQGKNITCTGRTIRRGCKGGKNCRCCIENYECPSICPDNYNPLCGTDGITYSNRCQLKIAKCNNPDDKIRVLHKGKCEDKCPSMCPEVVEPVCGSDRITYQNECELSVVSCNNPENNIVALHKGECDHCELPYVKVDGQCLLFITEGNKWDESVEKCKEYRDTDIAVLTDIKEVALYMRQQNLKVTWWHVGAHNREDHTKHTWINGGDDVTGPWETINSREPSLSDGNQCVHINPGVEGGVLADNSCNIPLPVICSKNNE